MLEGGGGWGEVSPGPRLALPCTTAGGAASSVFYLTPCHRFTGSSGLCVVLVRTDLITNTYISTTYYPHPAPAASVGLSPSLLPPSLPPSLAVSVSVVWCSVG